MPCIASSRPRDSGKSKAAQFVAQACRAAQKISGKRAQQRGGNCREECSAGLQDRSRGVEMAEHQLAVNESVPGSNVASSKRLDRIPEPGRSAREHSSR